MLKQLSGHWNPGSLKTRDCNFEPPYESHAPDVFCQIALLKSSALICGSSPPYPVHPSCGKGYAFFPQFCQFNKSKRHPVVNLEFVSWKGTPGISRYWLINWGSEEWSDLSKTNLDTWFPGLVPFAMYLAAIQLPSSLCLPTVSSFLDLAWSLPIGTNYKCCRASPGLKA